MYCFDAVVHKCTQRVNILFVFRRDEDAVLAQPRHPRPLKILQRQVLPQDRRQVIFLLRHIRKIIDFVKDHDSRFILFADIGYRLFNNIELLLEIRVRDIHHMHQQIRLAYLIQRGLERLHQMMR